MTEPRTRNRLRFAGAPRAAGFTLIELLIVLSIVAVLMGISAGIFKKMAMGKMVAVSQVKDAIRAARTFAIEQSAQATVDVDPATGRIVASGFTSVGNWHFEDDKSTGWPTDADLTGGAEIVDDGAFGRALRLPEGSRGFVTLGRSPSFDATQGFLLDLYVRATQSQDAPILSKGRAFQLHLTADFGLTFNVRGRDRGLVGKGEGEVRSFALARCVTPGRWSHVVVSYDGKRLYITVDGIERDRKDFESRLDLWPEPDSPLEIGSPDTRFLGDVDEVRLATSIVNDAPPLGDGVHFEKPLTIYFDASGRLDPLRHSAPVQVTLVFDEEQRRRDVRVGLFGEIE